MLRGVAPVNHIGTMFADSCMVVNTDVRRRQGAQQASGLQQGAIPQPFQESANV
jgi:hypothetical protein